MSNAFLTDFVSSQGREGCVYSAVQGDKKFIVVVMEDWEKSVCMTLENAESLRDALNRELGVSEE